MKQIQTIVVEHTKISSERSFEEVRRYAAELGYEVTVVRDATADYSDREMHATLEVNLRNYASAIMSTDEIVDWISSLKAVGMTVQ